MLAAASSMITVTWGWCWRTVDGHRDDTGPSTSADTARAFWWPFAMSTTCLASRMVAKPWVMQCLGTAATSPSKNRALSDRVRALRVLTLVLEPRDEPGSLERDMPIGADPENLEIDATGSLDVGLVPLTSALDIRIGVVGRVHLIRVHPHWARECAEDDVAVALGVILGQAEVLVQRERCGARKGQAMAYHPSGQFGVHADGTRPSGESQHSLGPPANEILDQIRGVDSCSRW